MKGWAAKTKELVDMVQGGLVQRTETYSVSCLLEFLRTFKS